MPTALVTGSSDGIGRVLARQLAAHDWQVLVHARDEQRGQAALAEVAAAASAGVPVLVTGDLASLDATRALAGQVQDAASDGLDVLVHNAGVWVREGTPATTGDGLEMTLQVNVLAPHLLTDLLREVLTPTSRTLWLGSGLARTGHVDPASVGTGGAAPDAGRAYADSKAADVALASGWARRLAPAGTHGDGHGYGVSAAVDPGWVKTKLASAGAPGEVEDGADTLLWCATQPELASGYYRQRRPTSVPPALRDEALQEALLAACDRATGLG